MNPDPSPLDYEKSLERLDAIVKRLEAGDLGLEESLALFEEGTGLTRLLSSTLDQAERRVEVLLESRSGELGTRPFVPEEED